MFPELYLGELHNALCDIVQVLIKKFSLKLNFDFIS